MSTQLERLGVELIEGYEASQLRPRARRGRGGQRHDPRHAGDRGTPEPPPSVHVRSRVAGWGGAAQPPRSSACPGTHGKTTTTSLLAWILECAGRHAGFLIGGVPADFPFSARLGTDPVFVIEADEYDTAFFDKRAKFLLYRPQTLIINNLEFDHADIYPDLEAITQPVPSAGPGSARQRAAGRAGRRCQRDGPAAARLLDAPGHVSPAGPIRRLPAGSASRIRAGTLRVLEDGREVGRCQWQLSGRPQCRERRGGAPGGPGRGRGSQPGARRPSAGFRGVQRRLQRLGEFRGIQVFDDFAHHPTAIRRTLEGVRQRAGIRRVIAVFEPRSNSMKLGIYQGALAPALGAADLAFVLRPAGLKWDLDAEFRADPRIRVLSGRRSHHRESRGGWTPWGCRGGDEQW